MAIVTWFITPTDKEGLEEIRNAIYSQKENNHVVVMDGGQGDIDMFCMDYIEAPANNFQCISNEAYKALKFTVNAD